MSDLFTKLYVVKFEHNGKYYDGHHDTTDLQAASRMPLNEASLVIANSAIVNHAYGIAIEVENVAAHWRELTGGESGI